MASSLGKMPTTSVRRLISPLSRSIGLVECSLVRCCVREGHVGEHVGLGLVHEARRAWAAGAGAGRRPGAIALARGLVVLGEGRADEGGDDRRWVLPAWARAFRMKCTRQRCQVALSTLGRRP